jgi:hypothetical protein
MYMKRTLIVVGAIALVGMLIASGVLAGAILVRGHWGIRSGGRGMMGGAWGNAPSVGNQQGCGSAGFGMMGGASGMPCSGAYTAPGQGKIGSLEDAQAAVGRYVQDLGNSNLMVAEVMEFERNYYAIVAEKDTGIGAMELLVDKSTGAVGPEMGPNMMWNAKYGMMGRGGMMGRSGMMGGSAAGEMTLSSKEASDIAQRWLDANLAGRTAGQPDVFYGYYTFHFLKDGKIDGMLSVNGSSGDVWYHSWHGSFIAGTEGNQ